MTIKKHMFFHCLLLFPVIITAQYLENPSMEGPPAIGVSPPAWIPYSPGSTPDTEPLDCDHYPASHGKTYITLVAHGSSSSRPNSFENCQTALALPLLKGGCYTLSVDLSSRDDLGHYKWGEGFIFYRAAVKLKIYCSGSISEKGQLIAESDPVTNVNWETLSFNFKPENESSYLLLEVSLTEAGMQNGNILIDNLILTDSPVESTVVLNQTLTPSDLPFSIGASESISYSWSPETGLSCYDCKTPLVNNPVSRTYTCSIISPVTGCPANELFILTFDEIAPLPEEFWIPNVFTPNGDGVNDRFEILNLPPFSALLIYDRSGRELFSSEAYDHSWSGTDMEGNPLPEDTYWYVLTIPGQNKKQKGSVYLKLE
jgi:gliding motility-associated-like protein